MADGKFSNFTTRPAKDFSLEITDKGGTDITIGAESGGYYPLSTSLTGKLTAGTWGRFHDGTATDNNVIVGRIKKGACTVAGGGLTLGTASGGGLSGGGLSVTGNKTSITPTVSVTLSAQTTSGVDITNDEPGSGYYLTINGSSSSDSAVVNRAKVDRAAFSQKVTRAAITDAHTAGYIPAKSATTVINSDSKTVTLDAGSIAADSKTITVNAGSKTRYITIPSLTSEGGGLTTTKDYTVSPTITITPTNTVGGTEVEESDKGSYYIKIVANSAKLTGTTTVKRAALNITTAGYQPIGTLLNESSQNASVTVNSGSTTKYIKIPSAVYANGFVNSAGYIPEGTNVYTTEQTDECITINFN